MNAKSLMSLAAVLFVVWLLAVVAFKVAGALIHLLLIAAAVLFIASLVMSAGGRRQAHP
ncbi:lmo0937 family membrane protein [Vitiosangium sp. GDMCC 1.1324]|uniref:lmo0937 family membrane protein n=1 Tax=Vitiosangium sp. (strain GDMCC 1.1324) TaxID=2138576 RepID=UPI000D3B956E|nr:lmo0937 family membrane protein [Vitiosangium sp. GDMCC 1.1324]PTL85114.1 lmo0937 family membrane protein [Vitiosangium sp. GDMCC 1.1324]